MLPPGGETFLYLGLAELPSSYAPQLIPGAVSR